MNKKFTRKLTILMLAITSFMAQAFYLHAEVSPPVKKQEIASFDESFEDFDFNVYPNPYREGPINLEIDGNVSKALQIKLYNTIGKVVLSKEYQSGINNYNITLAPTLKLAPGLYFLSVSMQGENFSKTKKLIVSE